MRRGPASHFTEAKTEAERVYTRMGTVRGSSIRPSRSDWRPVLPPGPPSAHSVSTCQPWVSTPSPLCVLCPPIPPLSCPPGSTVATPARASPRPTPRGLFLRRPQLELEGRVEGRTERQVLSRRPATEAADCTLARADTHGRVPGGEGPAPARGPRFAGGRAAPAGTSPLGRTRAPVPPSRPLSGTQADMTNRAAPLLLQSLAPSPPRVAKTS